MHRKLLLLLLTLLPIAQAASAATFVVPSDRELIRRADAIVVATAIHSYSRPTEEDGIETATMLAVEDTLKGTVGDSVEVVEPGGVFAGRAMVLAGVPKFEDGRRMMLFLTRTPGNRWAVTELVLGKFTFDADTLGEPLLVRDEPEITGWDPDMTPHVEQRRNASRFLDFVRNEARGRMTAADYTVAVAPLDVQRERVPGTTSARRAVPMIAPYSATSYTMVISGSLGSRWNVFPNPVNWYSGTTTEAGAPGGGVTAIQAGIAAWDNDCGSNVNYAYAGSDDGTHTQGLHGPDGRNTVLFERDLSAWGVAPFSCSSSGYSGTLGLGGVTSASGQNTVNGETFVTTTEGDVEMNRGIANCTLLFNNGDFNSAVAHELGHTLGFRHSDQNRTSDGSCSTDTTLECSVSAIMKSFVTTGINATLQSWDQHAVQAVYPGNVCAPSSPPACTAPAITTQPASPTIIVGNSTALSVTASGTAPLSYQWYIGSSGYAGNPIVGATGPGITVSPRQTTTYWVRVTNSCGTANSTTATVTVTNATCTAPSVTTQPASPTLVVGNSTTLYVTATGTAPLSYQWYIGSSPYAGNPIAGATASSITVSPRETTTYWVRVTNGCGTANSNTATVTVTNAPSCTAPAITSQPASPTLVVGQSTTLSVTASGTGPLSYQWYIGSSPYAGNPIAGATSPSITVSPRETTTYWVRVTNSCGVANSNTANVTVTNAPNCTAPSITSQPASPTLIVGQSTTLSVSVSGTTPLSYQWYIGSSPYTGNPIAGATSSSITVSPRVTTTYWVRVTNSCGVANSNTATVTVTN